MTYNFLGLNTSTKEVVELVDPTVSLSPFDIDVETTYFIDRMTWISLTDNNQKLSMLKRLYHGRGGMKAGWWDSETTKWHTDWTLPPTAVGVNTRESAPWNNAIHLRNSKDGSNIDQLYLTPKIIACNKFVMRVDMSCPTLSNMPTGAADVVLGFEIPFQGGTTICMLYISKSFVKIWGKLLKADGTVQELSSSDISSWVATGTWKEFRFILNPPKFRLVDADTPTNYAELNFDQVTFFPKVVPFFANECPSVIFAGVYIGQFAVWRI